MTTIRFALVAAAALVAVQGCAAPDSQTETSATATFTSDRLTVETQGAGPDIVLVPGLASHRDVWAEVADSLDERYRLHLVQVNGFAGLAPGANADGPVSAPVADELARYIREMELEQPAVIGHSMGGTIVMMLAARHPESVGRVMVVDMFPELGSLFAPNAPPGEMQHTAEQYRTQILADAPGTPTGVLEQMFPGMTRVEAKRAMLMDGVRGTHRQTAANAFAEMLVTDLRPELARIAVPMTVLYVQPPDVPMPPEQFDAAMRQAYANAPRARLVRIADSNHFIMFDRPGVFVAEVDALMRTPLARR